MKRLVSLRGVTVVTVILSTVALGVSPVLGQKTLRWKLQPGEKVKVHLTQNMDYESSIQGTTIKSSVQMIMTMNWEVLRVAADGTAEMNQSIEHMKMVMNSPGAGAVTYDSASQEEPTGIAKDLAHQIEPLIGIKFIQKMNDRGEILDVKLTEEASRALDKVPAGAELKQIFSEEGMKSLVNQAAAVLPEKPVRPGDIWKGGAETKSPVGSMKMEINYLHQGSEQRDGRDVEKIGVDVKLHFPDEQNNLGLTLTVKEQDNRGFMYFDAASGHVVETQLQQQLTLETAIGGRTHQQKVNTNLRMQFQSDRMARQPRRAGPRLSTRRRNAPRR